MPIPPLYFRLRDSRIFAFVWGAGHLVLALGFFYFALTSNSKAMGALLLLFTAISALIGCVILLSAVGAGKVGDNPPKNGRN